MLKKGDVILVALILTAIILGVAGTRIMGAIDRSDSLVAVIKQGDRVIRRINLEKVGNAERIVVSGDYRDTILVEKGRIRFEDADCPDHVCVRTGWLSEKGDTAVCIPNRTMIKITGEKSKVDIVTD